MKEDNVLSQPSETAPVASPAFQAGNPLMAKKTKGSSKARLDCILATLEEEKAEEVVTIALAGKSEMADHMVIATGRSSRQVSAIAEKTVDALKSELQVFCKVEGRTTGDWVLVDAGDIIVHIFRPEVREFYQLEKMWANAGTASDAE